MDKKSFGEVLEELINLHDISVASLARKTDINPKTLSEYIGKDGRFPSSPEVLVKLAKFFNCSVHELLTGEPDPNSVIGSILDKVEVHTGLYEISIKKVNIKEK